MSTLPQTFVVITPRDLRFEDVRINESYKQSIRLENTLSYPVHIDIKPGNSFRYKLSETNLTLQSNESKHIEIELKLTKSISAKALKIKDIFYIKSDFFNDHITAQITMADKNNNDNITNNIQQTNTIPTTEMYHFPDLTETLQSNQHQIEHDRILQENEKLKKHASNLEHNVSELKIELEYLHTIKTQINASIPDLETIVDATIGKERALNEVRNKKVLQILTSKDEEIENLKQMSKHYQAVEASLHVLQKKHVDLTQILHETQNENKEMKVKLKQHKEEILKLNDKISSYSQQSQFQKKIVRERDLRIKELTNDIEETQNMLQKSTKTMKQSYSEQIKELQSRLSESETVIQGLTDKLHKNEIKYKNDCALLKEMDEECSTLRQWKNEREGTFQKEMEQIKKEMNDTLNVNVAKDHHQQINYLQIELAKLRSFVRLGLFNNNENVINYQKGKNINKKIVNELARKSAHLSASQAIIQQQRDRIAELEKLQKMTNQSVFEQSMKLNETNKKLTNNSSENQRLLNIHKRQIEILNKKLSDSINREEAVNIKLKNLRQKLNVSETEYVDKIEELEQALQAINVMHKQTKRKKLLSIPTSKSSSSIASFKSNHNLQNNEYILKIVELENTLTKTQHELQSVDSKLHHEMTQRQSDIKANNIKLENNKKLYEKQINRLQSIIDQMKTNINKPHRKTDHNINRLIELNNELAQSEKLKNQYFTELEVIKTKYHELQNYQQLQQTPNPPISTKTINENRDQLLLEINEKCFKQKEEIEQLENMINAAITELKKYNPDIVDKLQSTKHQPPSRLIIETPAHHIAADSPLSTNEHTISSTKSTPRFTYDADGIVADVEITRMKEICDEEIIRYQKLYENVDREYQAYKKKMNQEIQDKDESYLNELAQQKQQITKLQAEIGELRKTNLNEQQKSQELQLQNQSLMAKLEQQSEIEIQHPSDIATSGDISSQNQNGIHNPLLSRSENRGIQQHNDMKHMQEIVTHQDAQIKVLMNTIETLQHHKPKKSQIIELTGRLATHETLQLQRKKELESIRSQWIKDQEARILYEKQCHSLKAKLKTLKFEITNTKQQNESIRGQFENYQRQILEKENKIHELELSQSRLQSIRKQLESRANIMQNELDNLSQQHFQHLRTLSDEHQNQLKKLTDLHYNNNGGGNKPKNAENDGVVINSGSLGQSISNEFHETLKTLTRSIEKYLIHEQQIFDDQKKKLGLTSIEFASLMNTNNINQKSKALGMISTIQDKHQFMKQLMNIVNQQYGNIMALQKQSEFYEWLSRHHYNKRRESETNVLSLECELQVFKKHLKRNKDDMDHYQLMIQQQLQTRKHLVKEQMNKAIHRYLILEKKCNTLKSELSATKKQRTHFETQYHVVLNKLNSKSIDLTQKEVELKQNISDELSINASERDKQLKEYLHDNLKKIIQETVRKYQKNDLYENQIFELSNELLSLKYVQNELTTQLEKALFDNQEAKNQNRRLSEMIRNSNVFLEKIKKNQTKHDSEKSNDLSENSTASNSASQSPRKVIRGSKDDMSIMELEQEICDKKLENESLRNQINGLQKDIEELLEQMNVNKVNHENELKNMREQIAEEREVLIQNHNNEIANNHQQNQQKIQNLQNEMEQIEKRVRPWTDSLDLNQLKQTCESQSHELSRANIHLQTLRTTITKLEYELSDTQKEMESQKFVIDHLQDTIKLFSANNDETDERLSKPSTKLIVSTLCKELIKSRKAQSNAMIKLRVASQSEIELQETISSREKRINELKQHLSTNKYAMHQGQVMDITKNDRKMDELVLEIASKDAEIRHLKKKLSIEQSKITVVYDIEPLQELVQKIDSYYYNVFGSRHPFKHDAKPKVIIENDLNTENLRNQIKYLMDENRKLRTNTAIDRNGNTSESQRKQSRQDRLEITSSKNKLKSLVTELNGYINKIKSVCTISLGKSSQRSTLKLKKIEDLCKLQYIKITACSDQIDNLLMDMIQNIEVLDSEYQGLQIAHDKLQQHIADEKTKSVEMGQELQSMRFTMDTHKAAERAKRQNLTNQSMQTDGLKVNFDTKMKIKSLESTIKSLRKSKKLETQDWRDDMVQLHEQLLQSKIDVNRYQKECQELQKMYLELKSQLKHHKKKKSEPYHPAISTSISSTSPSPSSQQIIDHRLQLQSIEWKQKVSSLQHQLKEANNKWKESELKYQKLLSHNIELKQKASTLDETVKALHGEKKEKLNEMAALCETLQKELEETKREYERQSAQIQKLKDRNHKLKHKNEELNRKTLSTERRSDEETCKLREQLISAQCENKKIRDLVEDLQHQIVENEANIDKMKCDNDADMEMKQQSHRSRVRDLHEKYDKDVTEKDQQIKQLEQLYEEEQEHHQQHFQKLMEEFNEYKVTQTRIQRMYEVQLNLLKKRFETAMIAEQERATLMNENIQSHTTSTASLRRLKSPNITRSRNLGKSPSISRICVSDYSSLMYDLSQRDSALKSLKSELKSIKLTLKRKDKECQRLKDSQSDTRHRNKKDKRRLSMSPPVGFKSPKKDETACIFEIRASAVWSARLAHCHIQITELKKKLTFEQELGIQKDEDIENYKFEIKQLKLQISNKTKKLDHRMSVESKKKQSFETERQNWKNKEREWEQEQDKLAQDIIGYKKTIKRLREDVQRKEYMMQQHKEQKQKAVDKMESIKMKTKSMSFYDSEQYKELSKDIESLKNQIHLKENLVSDLKKKYQKLQHQFDKMQINNQELQSKNRQINSEVARKDVLVNELKHKLQNLERENISNKANSDMISKLKQKCKQLKSNENRKDELWRTNKEKLESVTKELNSLKHQNSQKQLKFQSKLSKIQNEEQTINKKYSVVKNESVELKAIVDTLYNKLSMINDELISTLNELQTNYYKTYKRKQVESDDTMKAAQILDDFSVNELEEIMNIQEQKEKRFLKPTVRRKAILWDKYEEKTMIIQLFEKIINERIRLEMMIDKLRKHERASSNLQSDQFEKIKMKHQQHLNEYKSMLNKFKKHK